MSIGCVADISVVGDTSVVVRLSATATSAEARELAMQIRALVARSGAAHEVVVVRVPEPSSC